MRPVRIRSTLSAAALLVTACASGADPTGGAGDQPATELAGSLSDEDAREAGAAVTAFGFDLHRAVVEPDANTVTSPLSASVLLSMVAAGADGPAGDEMVELLRLDHTRDTRPAALLAALTADGHDVDLSVANSLWADEGVPFEDDYVSFVRDTFGATLDEVDLASQAAADRIDAWVEDRTEGLIEELAEDLGLPNAQAVLVLVNAVHFLGTWTTTFEVDDTRDAPFTLADGDRVEVPTMHRTADDVAVASGEGWRMLRLPYGEDERFGMEVVLPDEDVALDDLLADLDADAWQAAVDDLTEQSGVPVALPRFDLEWDADLSETLADLGMPSAFAGDSFAPMSPADPFLSTVVQRTAIRVDEEGTEAAAVTGGAMELSAPVPFEVDRPFAFTVSDRDTGTVLFLGSVHDPRG